MCFVYQGVVYIGQERLTQFLKTAEFLQIKGLSEHCIGEPFQRQQTVTQSSPSQSASTALPSPPPPPLSDTPSPSPSFKDAPRPSQSSAPTSAPLPPAKRRKPLYPLPLHTPAPSTSACQPGSGDVVGDVGIAAATGVAEQPGNSSSPSRPSQSSPVEVASVQNGVRTDAAEPAGPEHAQEEALSLVTESSILRQRIEGRTEPGLVKLETNGPASNGSPPPSDQLAKLSPAPLMMDPNALSMVGRESLGR